MPSPTFNLVYRYEGRAGIRVWHVDLYRLRSPEEIWELGWQDLGQADEIVLVEWPERVESQQPADRWDIRIAPHPGGAGLRLVTAQPHGSAPAIPGPVPSRD